VSAFPIANALRNGLPLFSPFGWAYEQMHNDFKWNKLFSATNFFDINTASELYWQGRQDYYSLNEDFGSMLPPYDKVWMEWTLPKRVLAKGGHWMELESPYSWAANINSYAHGDSRIMDVNLFVSSPTAMVAPNFDGEIVPGVVSIPITASLHLDGKTGLVKDIYDYAPADAVEKDSKTYDFIRDELYDKNVVWMALQLMNCKNISTRPLGSVFSRSSAQKRKGEPTVKYQTIVLPGSQTGHHSTGRRPKQDVLALHKVRGHFKTFTPERPLLGRHVGTYWWGWQVRGNPENGVVISDYQLKQPGTGVQVQVTERASNA
jgi:hypothetical protein